MSRNSLSSACVVMAVALLCSAAQAQSAAQSQEPWRHARINQIPDLLGLSNELAITGLQMDAPPRAMELNESMREGMVVSLDAQAAEARNQAAKYTQKAALGALLPRLDIAAGTGRGRLDIADPNSELPRREASATLRQSVLDLGGISEFRRQRKLADVARLQAEGADSAAGLEVASAYLQALQARIVISLSEEQEARLQELLNYVDARADAGGTSGAESARVRARVANARAVIADSRANLSSSLRNLESLLGGSPSSLTISVPSALAIPATAHEAKSMAEDANFDLRAAAADQLAANYEADSYRSRFLPKIELQAMHRQDLNAAGTEVRNRDTRVMLMATWSLLNGGTDYAQAKSATYRSRSLGLQRASSLRKLGQEIDASYATLDAMQDRFAAVSEEMASNVTVVDAFRAQLVGGTRQLLDVLDAYQRLHQSRLDLAQLAISEVQNHIKVAHLIGLLPSMLAADGKRE